MTKVEYRKIIWGLLKDYRDDNFLFIREELNEGTMSLVELLNKIMAIPTPKEGNPYEGMSTREDVR